MATCEHLLCITRYKNFFSNAVSGRDDRSTAHAPCTNNSLNSDRPCLLIDPFCSLSPELLSDGLKPAYDTNWSDLLKRPISPIAAINTLPPNKLIPGIVSKSRKVESSSEMISLTCTSKFPTCSSAH